MVHGRMLASVVRLSGNQFFDHMPAGARTMLLPLLQRRTVHTGQVVYEPGESMTHVVFPLTCMLCVVLDLESGTRAEVGVIGREGMSGVDVALGHPFAIQRTLVQTSGLADVLPAPAFSRALERDPVLRAYVLKYAQATIVSSAQLAACNMLHQVPDRCARWLLCAHDRVDGDQILLTQEFLGAILGVSRGSVTLAASTLQRAGFIKYSRGHITVLNRAGLESAACECYRTISHNWTEIMGYPITEKRVADKATMPTTAPMTAAKISRAAGSPIGIERKPAPATANGSPT